MRKIKLSSLLVFGLSILLVFFFQYCKHAPGLGAANPFGEDPYDAVGSFAVLLAPLGALLMLVRVFRPFPGGRPDDGQLLSILRSGAVSLLAVGVTLVADAAGLGRALLTSGFFPAAVPLAALVGGMALLLVFVTGIFAREISGRGLRAGKGPWKRAVAINALGLLTLVFYPPAWREGSVQGAIFTAALGMLILFGMVWASATVLLPGEEPFREDIFDDLAALLRGWKNGLGRFAVPLVAFEKLASAPWMKKLVEWFRPRRHRWHLVLVFAAATGLILLLPELLSEGIHPDLGRFLPVLAVFVGLGAAGVLLGYFLLGEYLGIY